MITLHNGIVIKGEETTEDMYSSIDLVMAKIERQVPALQGEDPQPQGPESIHGQREIVRSVGHAVAEPTRARRGATQRGAAAAAEPKIIKKSKFFAKPLSTSTRRSCR